jgi:hypothetical protein
MEIRDVHWTIEVVHLLLLFTGARREYDRIKIVDNGAGDQERLEGLRAAKTGRREW